MATLGLEHTLTPGESQSIVNVLKKVSQRLPKEWSREKVDLWNLKQGISAALTTKTDRNKSLLFQLKKVLANKKISSSIPGLNELQKKIFNNPNRIKTVAELLASGFTESTNVKDKQSALFDQAVTAYNVDDYSTALDLLTYSFTLDPKSEVSKQANIYKDIINDEIQTLSGE